MLFSALNHIQPATYSILNPHLFNAYYDKNKHVFNKPATDSEMPATEELVGTAVAQWLRCCVTNQKVTGLTPDDVTGIFH